MIREIRAYKAKKESEFKECMKVVKKLVEEAEKTTKEARSLAQEVEESRRALGQGHAF